MIIKDEMIKVPVGEFSLPFVQGMSDRMTMSGMKYGPVVNAFPHKVNAIETLKACLADYEKSGETSKLMDVANYAMIEFMHPRRAAAKFEPTDESSGRVWNTGALNEQSNDHAAEAVRRGGLYKRDGD